MEYIRRTSFSAYLRGLIRKDIWKKAEFLPFLEFQHKRRSNRRPWHSYHWLRSGQSHDVPQNRRELSNRKDSGCFLLLPEPYKRTQQPAIILEDISQTALLHAHLHSADTVFQSLPCKDSGQSLQGALKTRHTWNRKKQFRQYNCFTNSLLCFPVSSISAPSWIKRKRRYHHPTRQTFL